MLYMLITLIFIVILGVLSFDMEVEDKLIENEIEILEEISKEEQKLSEIKNYYYDLKEKLLKEELIKVNLDEIKGDIYINIFNIVNRENVDLNKESLGEIVSFDVRSIEYLDGTITIRINDKEDTFNKLDEAKKIIVYDIIKNTYMEFNEISNVKVYINEVLIEK